jgi:prophage regulatory protein
MNATGTLAPTRSEGANAPKYSILRLPSVLVRTGLSRSSIYLRISEDAFPKPISLGTRSVGWVESEIDAWIASRIEQSRKRPG